MADDHFVTFDAAYVLGALSPEDRIAYEEHLVTCARCAAAVSELAGMPGLLARTRPDEDVPPAPDLLQALVSAVRRVQRRRRWLTASGWVVAAAAAAIFIAVLITDANGPTTTAAPQAMTAVSGYGPAAEISVTGVAWGAKLELRCTYPAQSASTHSYTLFVADRSGERAQQVGSWLATPGRTATIPAATDISAADLGRLEVRDESGRTVLQLLR